MQYTLYLIFEVHSLSSVFLVIAYAALRKVSVGLLEHIAVLCWILDLVVVIRLVELHIRTPVLMRR